MDGGRGWCMLRCGGSAKDKNIMNRIMLGFRPIAPKPVIGGSSTGGYQSENCNTIVSNKRQKRKYVRVSKNTRKKQEEAKTMPDDQHKKIVTLQLLPESRVDREESRVKGSFLDPKVFGSPKCLNFDNYTINHEEKTFVDLSGSDLKAVVESWVIVESVTDTCMDRVLSLGCTDEERMRNLCVDTCPGFISNGGNNVVEWVNEAFKGMMLIGRLKGESPTSVTTGSEVMVWLVIKDKVLPYLISNAAFTCRVRLVQYTFGKERFSQTLLCDTWRMDNGRFAWRLDVKAALCLGSFRS